MNQTTELISNAEQCADALLVFRAGDCLFCTTANNVVSIIEPPKISRVPFRSPACKGLTFFRGNPIAVFCLRTYIGIPVKNTDKTGVVIIVKQQDRMMGVWVDESLNIINIDKSQYMEPDIYFKKSNIKYFIPYNKKLLLYIDMENSLFKVNGYQKSVTGLNIYRSDFVAGPDSYQDKLTTNTASNESNTSRQTRSTNLLTSVTDVKPPINSPLLTANPIDQKLISTGTIPIAENDRPMMAQKEINSNSYNSTGDSTRPSQLTSEKSARPPAHDHIKQHTTLRGTRSLNDLSIKCGDTQLASGDANPTFNRRYARQPKPTINNSDRPLQDGTANHTRNNSNSRPANKHRSKTFNSSAVSGLERDTASNRFRAISRAHAATLDHSELNGRYKSSSTTLSGLEKNTYKHLSYTGNHSQSVAQSAQSQSQHTDSLSTDLKSEKINHYGTGILLTGLLILAVLLWQILTINSQTSRHAADDQHQYAASHDSQSPGYRVYTANKPASSTKLAPTRHSIPLTQHEKLPQIEDINADNAAAPTIATNSALHAPPVTAAYSSSTDIASSDSPQKSTLNTSTEISNIPSGELKNQINNATTVNHNRQHKQQIGMILQLESEALKITVERPGKQAMPGQKSRYSGAIQHTIQEPNARSEIQQTDSVNLTELSQHASGDFQLADSPDQARLATQSNSSTHDGHDYPRYEEYKYVVVKGDTLWDIAAKLLGDPYKYKLLSRFSNVRDPNWIYPGDIVTIRKLIRD